MAVDFSGGFRIEGPVRWYQSSEWGERGSCTTCGSALFWRMRDLSMITAAVGAFDDSSIFARIERHIFVDRKPSYYEFSDDAPRLTGAEASAALSDV